MAQPGQEWIPVRAVPGIQTVPAGDLCLCSGDTQHPVWGPDSDGGMAGRGQRVTAGEMQW